MTATDPDTLTDTPDIARAKSATGEMRASLYRMAMPGHLCPFGLKSKYLLEKQGYKVNDNLLTSRDAVDAFKKMHGVETTPQTFIGGERVGGYTDLRKKFGYRVLGKGDTTYRPVAAIFGMTALMAVAIVLNLGQPSVAMLLMWFFALSMCALAIQKLQDVEGFVNGFLGYDLLARRYVPYGYAYPYAEAFAGIGMLALIGHPTDPLVWPVAAVSLVIGTIGAVSVIKAVYIGKRELTCACVGGGSNVPLGAISLTENLVMMAMGIWMPLQYLAAT